MKNSKTGHMPRSMKYGVFVAVFFCFSGFAFGQEKPMPPELVVSARGVAIYGIQGKKETKLYAKNQGFLFPVASITKLVTAKVVTQYFGAGATFIAAAPLYIPGTNPQRALPAGVYTRDDLLRVMLVGSSNDISQLFAGYIGKDFLLGMNTFLQGGLYTKGSFYNGSGLDPLDKKFPVNRLTPYNMMHLLRDIYKNDPALSSMLGLKNTTATNLQTGEIVQIKSSNELNKDPLFTDRVVMSKTGRTTRAGENIAFITQGGKKFDYIVVVLLSSKNRYGDGKAVLDWLAKIDEQSKLSENNVKKEVSHSIN